MAHYMIVQKSELGLDSEYTTSRVLVPTRAEIDKILSIQKRVLEGRYTFSSMSCFVSPSGGLGNKDYKSYFLYRKFPELAPTSRIRKSSYSCNLVETVLFLILEPIYAVGFDENSCGFSSSNTKRSAYSTLKYISTNYISERWAIEGDISKCFDNYQTFMNILKERIRDELTLNLIKSSFNAKIYDSGKLWDPEVMGMRQGGKLYPLLCDIILDKLDKKVRELEKEICPYGSKILYARYADNFILLCDTSIDKAKEFKHRLSFYIINILKLNFNTDKTKIFDIRKGFKFLGFIFRTSRSTNSANLLIYLDIPKVFKLLSYLGFCNTEGLPIEHGFYVHKTQAETNKIMIFILNEFKNWFSIAINRKRAFNVVNYVIIYSLAKIYAAKFKLKTIGRTFAIAGKELNKPLKAADIRRNLWLKERAYNLPPVRVDSYNTSLKPFGGQVKRNISQVNLVMTDLNIRHDFLAPVYRNNTRLYSYKSAPFISP